MKKCLLIAAFAGLSLTASAQTDENKPHRINLNLGIASPSGNFKDTDMESDDAGLAKTGAVISAGYAVDLHENFGIGLTLGWRNNPVDVDKMAEEFGAEEEGLVELEGTSWQTSYIVTDLYAQLPLNQVTLYAKGSVGFGNSRSAGVSGTFDLGEYGTYEFEQTEAKSWSGVYGIAGGVRYDFGRLGLAVEAGVLSTKPEFEVEYDGETEKYKQEMNSFNTTIGLSYRL